MIIAKGVLMSVVIIDLVGETEEEDVLVFCDSSEEEEMCLESYYEGYLELQLMPIYEQKSHSLLYIV
jgi:hypothetical protein